MSLDERDPIERLTDRALLLFTIGFGERAGRVDAFRLMKIPFVVQREFHDKNLKSFSYNFYRDRHGPISKCIYEDRDALREAGFIMGDERSLRLTKLGDRLFYALNEIPRKDKATTILTELESVAERYASARSWEEIKPDVYRMTIPGTNVSVRDAALYDDILEKLPADEAAGTSHLPKAAINTMCLALSLTPEEFEAGSKDSGLTIEEVFAT